jgi:hypothetical protein
LDDPEQFLSGWIIFGIWKLDLEIGRILGESGEFWVIGRFLDFAISTVVIY